MVKKNIEKKLVIAIACALFLVVIGSMIYLKPQFTGFVIGPEGCDGNWTSENGSCINGTQEITWASNDTINCNLSVITTQTCEIVCEENWTCIDWTECADETQIRTCTDSASCGTNTTKPIESQTCEIVCEENWTCIDWTECADETQIRTCTDSASCGTNTTKPIESQSCTMPVVCGDGDCEGDEDCSSCSSDCGACEEETISEPITTTTETTTTESSSSTITSSVTKEVCTPEWECEEWTECIDNIQSRECIDVNACGTEEGKPVLTQSCVPPETCSDGLKNQDEKGIDCGGICEKKCSIFTIVGSVVSGPVDSGKEFFKNNKIKSIIILGAVVLIAGGFIIFKLFHGRYYLQKLFKKEKVEKIESS